MLRNLPPAQTRVKFTRAVRKAQANDLGSLVKALGSYPVDRPNDTFLVEFQGDFITVERQDIEEVVDIQNA